VSAIYAVVCGDEICILTDRAIYNTESHVLASIEAKVWSSPTLPLAVALVGDNRFAPGCAVIAQALSVDLAFSIIRREVVTLRSLLATEGGIQPAAVLVAGYTEARLTKGAHLSSVAAGGLEPWSVTDVGREFSRGPVVPPEAMAELFAGVEVIDGSVLARLGGDWFEMLRSAKMQAAGSEEWHHAVGGGVDLTTIGRHRAGTERLRDWPQDRIGEKIAP
jgi:hypothetical protein